jgi:hypothetical protein
MAAWQGGAAHPEQTGNAQAGQELFQILIHVYPPLKKSSGSIDNAYDDSLIYRKTKLQVGRCQQISLSILMISGYHIR